MMPQLVSSLVIAMLMLSIWTISIRRRDVSIVDIVWGLGFVMVAWTVWIFRNTMQESHTSVLLPVLVTIWGLRLSGYLFLRNHGRPEDYRYRHMRGRWGLSFWWISLFTVFILQGTIMWIVSLPLQTVVSMQSPTLSVLGSLIWTVGLVFESVGDWQLARFKSNPANRGRVLETGLWRYTRHPNYFGDFLVWWGLYLVALGHFAPWWTVVSPLLMSLLLMRVSGVTLLEKALRSNKPGYVDYARRTSAFFPKPPTAPERQ